MDKNFKTIKITCPFCDLEFTKSIFNNINPELGKVIFCPKCSRKLLYWNEQILTIHEVPRR